MDPTKLPLVAVAGATGEVGGRTARLLAGRLPLRVLARDPERAAALAERLNRGPDPAPRAPRPLQDPPAAAAASGEGPAPAPPSSGDAPDSPAGPAPLPGLPPAAGIPVDHGATEYADPEAAREALAGVAVLFMVSGAESSSRLADHEAFIRAAADAGVRHVVYTSFFRAAPDAVFTLARDHHATELMLAASGMATTMLRDNFYQDVFPFFAGADGVLRGPAGDGRVSAVARDDVAACAAVVLAETATALAAGTPGRHAGAVYDLTGPEAFSMAEAAAAVTAATGRSVAYHDETLEEARASRAAWDPEPWQLDAWVSTYTAIASGDLAPVSGDVGRLLNRPAQSLARTLALQGRGAG